MPTRIDIELTSSRDDGTWTWRAAGARQPKGVLDGALLATGAKVGDVLRADAEMDLDGINILSVTAPKAKRNEPQRLEVIGPPRTFTPVTSTIANFRERDGERGRERGPRRPGSGPGGARPMPGERRDRGATGRGAPGPRREREGARPRPETPERTGPPTGAGGGEQDRGRPYGPVERQDPRRPRSDRTAPRSTGRGDRADRPERSERRPERGTRPGVAGSGAPGRGGPGAPGRSNGSRPAPERPRPKRIQPGRAHRDALLATLEPQERVVAEQVLRGGLSGVRQAIEVQNAAARAAGEPEVKADALVALAEDLAARLRVAEWTDRAEAAVADVDAIGLRDLRAVASGGDVARDEETRALAVRLREALERRTSEERQRWLEEITAVLDSGRVVRALRLSARPPDVTTRFPSELSERLDSAAGAALGPETAPDRWVAVLEGVLASPVRRTVRPVGLPADPPPELIAAARAAAARVPGLLGVLGLERAPIPPPPRPRPPQPRRPAPHSPRSASTGQSSDPSSASAPPPPTPLDPDPAPPPVGAGALSGPGSPPPAE
ncbi:MAG: hypothetical protein ACYDAD_12460 [Acidimicrobiales bacterium]